MVSRFLGPDPLEEQIEEALVLLERGRPPTCVATSRVDIKEEPGRRNPQGRVLPGHDENDRAARYLAGEMACMANTAGGGVLILGVADDGTRIGTRLRPEWLRFRIWELTERKLTVAVRVAELGGRRLLVLSHPRGYRAHPLPRADPLASGRQLRGDRSHDVVQPAVARLGTRLVGATIGTHTLRCQPDRSRDRPSLPSKERPSGRHRSR